MSRNVIIFTYVKHRERKRSLARIFSMEYKFLQTKIDRLSSARSFLCLLLHATQF